MRSCWKRAILAFGLVGFASLEAGATSSSIEPDSLATLTIGRATRDVASEARHWQRLLTKLNDSDDANLNTTIDLHFTSGTAGLLWNFWDRKVHIIIGNPFLAASLIREADAVPLLIIEEPEPSYQRSVIIVRESDAASDPGDLSGHRLAFARHGSDLGHLLPHSMLLSYGLKVVETAEDADVHDDHVAVHHINDDLSPLLWLYRSGDEPRAAAIAMRDFSKIERVRPELFRPILASQPIPIAIVIAAADVDEANRLMLTERLEQERAELFRALGYGQDFSVRLRRVTSHDEAIIDLVQRLDGIDDALANQR